MAEIFEFPPCGDEGAPAAGSRKELLAYLASVEGSHPYLGTLGQLRTEPELKVEVACPTGRVEAVLAAVKRVHPYEEPVINVIPLYRTGL